MTTLGRASDRSLPLLIPGPMSTLLIVLMGFCLPVSFAGSVTYSPDLVWELQDDQTESGFIFGAITGVVTDESRNTYLLDAQLCEISVVDSTGVVLGQIGNRGSGPGEFLRPVDLIKIPGGLGVVEYQPNQLVKLTYDGRVLGQTVFSLPEDSVRPLMHGLASFPGGYVGVFSTSTVEPDKSRISFSLAEADHSGKIGNRYLVRDRVTDFSRLLFRESDYQLFNNAWTQLADWGVAARLNYSDYRIGIWSADGSDYFELRVPYERHQRPSTMTKAIKQRWESRYDQSSVKPVIQMEDSWSPVFRLFGRPDTTLWVQSSRCALEAPRGTMTSFDVFDRTGSPVTSVQLLGAAIDALRDDLFISGEFLYVIRSGLDTWYSFQGMSSESTLDDDFDAGPRIQAFKLPNTSQLTSVSQR